MPEAALLDGFFDDFLSQARRAKLQVRGQTFLGQELGRKIPIAWFSGQIMTSLSKGPRNMIYSASLRGRASEPKQRKCMLTISAQTTAMGPSIGAAISSAAAMGIAETRTIMFKSSGLLVDPAQVNELS